LAHAGREFILDAPVTVSMEMRFECSNCRAVRRLLRGVPAPKRTRIGGDLFDQPKNMEFRVS
jgi:hypothetical protein